MSSADRRSFNLDFEEEVFQKSPYDALSFRMPTSRTTRGDDGGGPDAGAGGGAFPSAGDAHDDGDEGHMYSREKGGSHYSSGGASFNAAHSAAVLAEHNNVADSNFDDASGRNSRDDSSSNAAGPSTQERRKTLLGMMGFRWTRCLLYNLCVAGIVAAIVLPVTLLVGGGNSSGGGGGEGGVAGDTNNTAASSSVGGDGNSTASGRRRRGALRSALLGLPTIPASTASALDDSRSPQSLALDFLTSGDALRLDPSSSSTSNELGPRFALSTLYYSTGGGDFHWDLSFGFTSDLGVCRWNRQVKEYGLGFPYKGAFCFDGQGVDSLVLPDNNLVGHIPPELSLLTDLEVLHLYSNSLIHSIPPSLTNLSGLTILDLHGNRLDGPIPPDLGDGPTALEHLDLSRNELTGSIPRSLERLVTRRGSSLVTLDLGRNELTGTVHGGWLYPGGESSGGSGSSSSSLRWLSLSDNYLSGEVPSGPEPEPSRRQSVGAGTEETAAPNGAGAAADVTSQRTQQGWSSSSSPLTDLSMGSNFFSGGLPLVELLKAHPDLVTLSLSDNRISDSLPREGLEGTASNLRALYLGRNKIRGTVPAAILLPPLGGGASASAMANLEVLDLQRNRLTGALPDRRGSSSSGQQDGDGTAAGFGALSQLRELNLGRNRLKGRLPESLGNATGLRVLRLERNNFTGKVPRSWARLTNLETLLLANNSITGDATFMCEESRRDIGLFLADCLGFDAEVSCDGCCTACCSDRRGPGGAMFGCFTDDIFEVGGPT